MQVWRNWQTRMVQVHMSASSCRFKSCHLHQKRKISPTDWSSVFYEKRQDLKSPVTANFADAKFDRVSRATRDLTRLYHVAVRPRGASAVANNLFRLRARALFFSSLQFPSKIPAGVAQRDFPVPRGHCELHACATRPS